MPRNPKDFKWLERHGLVAVPTRGDGNCLFNALSDQTVGNQENHVEIRARVIEHMRDNSEYYKSFIVVEPGGGLRRNPKRKNVAVPKAPITPEPPSEAQIDEAFENHLTRMAQGGTYGDNMEIVAFSRLYNIDVKVYQWTGHAYYISAPDSGIAKSVVHIAHHEYEHFSSIRNISGPFEGLPDVHDDRTSAESNGEHTAVATPTLAPWMIKTVETSLPYYVDPDTIRNTLIACQCDVDEAVTRLIDLGRSSPTSVGSGSRSGSSSVERDVDGEDQDHIYGPNKRQNRKESLARKALRKQKQAKQQATPAIEILRPSIEISPSLTPVSDENTIPNSSSIDKPKSASDSEAEWAPGSSTDSFRLQSEDNDSNSIYSDTTLSQSQSVISNESRPRPKIILRTKNVNSSLRSSSHISDSASKALSTTPPASPAASQYTIISTSSTASGSKTAQKQNGPQKKKPVTAAAKKDLKKKAQKQARKESKKNKPQAANTTESPQSPKKATRRSKRISPPMDQRIKVLHI